MVLVQAMAETPLTYYDILARARPTTEQWRMDSRVAEWRSQLQETRGFLREGPTLSLDAGARRSPGFVRSTDKGVELEWPLFRSPTVRSDMERSLGQADPLLVEGERLKAQQELDEARTQMARAWAALVALAELPSLPVPLADPGAIQTIPEDNIAASLRLPRPGEATSVRQSTETQIRVLQGEYRQALAELDARILGVVYRFQKASTVSPVPDFTRAIQEVGQRLEAGKEQPSEAFPIRRQLLEAQMAALKRIQARHAITAEIQYLLP
jgi:hypothetical protein